MSFHYLPDRGYFTALLDIRGFYHKRVRSRTGFFDPFSIALPDTFSQPQSRGSSN
ncbi:hypothetical protein [Microcoleus sp. Pol10D4]|uniref:hypothetical protein n=1 Tax=Microcoleus sp. Pol10D4 TaxID=3055387 RepID=UPI002FD6B8E5